MTHTRTHINWNAKAQFKDTTDGRINPVDKRALDAFVEKYRPKCIEERFEDGYIIKVYAAAYADGSVVPKRCR